MLATITPPTLEPVEDEIETETALVGEDGEPLEGEELEAARPRATPPRARPPQKADSDPRTSPEPLLRLHARRLAGRRARQPGSRLRREPAQRRLQGRGGARPPLGAAEGQEEVRGRADRGPHRPGRPARRGPAPADLHERGRPLRRPGARLLQARPRPRCVVVHDEIDLPFGDIRARLGGGLAGHNGLKSLKRELGGPDFHRVRVGVGRPDSTDPEIVAAYVLAAGASPPPRSPTSSSRAADEVERARHALVPERRRVTPVCDNVRRMSPRDWDAATYQRLSAPIEAMGRDVLWRLRLRRRRDGARRGLRHRPGDRGARGAAAARPRDRGRRLAGDGRRRRGGGCPTSVDVREADLLELDARGARRRDRLDRDVPLDRRPRPAVRAPARRAEARRAARRAVRRRGQRGGGQGRPASSWRGASRSPSTSPAGRATGTSSRRRTPRRGCARLGYTDVWTWETRVAVDVDDVAGYLGAICLGSFLERLPGGAARAVRRRRRRAARRAADDRLRAAEHPGPRATFLSARSSAARGLPMLGIRPTHGNGLHSIADGARSTPRGIRAALGSVHPVWWLNLAIWAAAIALFAGPVGDLPPLHEPHVAWWWLALGFLSASAASSTSSSAATRTPSRSATSRSSSASCSPAARDLVIAAVVGPALTLLLDRRLPPIKLFFNLGQFALSVCLATLICYWLAPGRHRLGPAAGDRRARRRAGRARRSASR